MCADEEQLSRMSCTRQHSLLGFSNDILSNLVTFLPPVALIILMTLCKKIHHEDFAHFGIRALIFRSMKEGFSKNLQLNGFNIDQILRVENVLKIDDTFIAGGFALSLFSGNRPPSFIDLDIYTNYLNIPAVVDQLWRICVINISEKTVYLCVNIYIV